MARTLVKRAAAHVWSSNFTSAIEDFDAVLNSKEYSAIIGDKDCTSLAKDKAQV
jgi:hypothetical protein